MDRIFAPYRIKAYFNTGTLRSVEQHVVAENGEEMFLDLLIRIGDEDLPLEVKFWRRTTLNRDFRVVADQLAARLQNYDQVWLEFGKTSKFPISGPNDPAVTLLTNELAARGLTWSIDSGDMFADVIIRFP
jgi:hypothetical protein